MVEELQLAEMVPDSLLGYVQDFIILDDGRMVISDARMNHLVFLDRNRVFEKVVGRQGQGPLEFMMPAELGFVGDTLVVRDRMNNRIQYLDMEGNLLGQWRPLKPVDSLFPISFTADGHFFSPTYGYGTDYLVSVGKLNSDNEDMWAPVEVKYSGPLLLGIRQEDARSRRVPDPHKNQVTVIALPDGGVILAHLAIPVFRKISGTGEVLWRVERDHHLFQEIRNEIFDLTLERSGPRVYSIRFWRGGVADGSGGCYLLLNRGDRLRLFHLRNNGDLTGPIEGPEGNYSKMVRFEDRLWACDRSTFQISVLEVIETRQKPE